MSNEEGRRRISPTTWAEIGGLWEAGEHTLKDLENIYDIHVETISRKMKALGYEKGVAAKEAAEEVREATARNIIAGIDDRMDKAKKLKEDHLKWVESLGRMTMAEVLRAQKAKAPMSTVLDNLKALEKAIMNVGRVREEAYALLNVAELEGMMEGELPELPIQEMTAEEVAALRQEQEDIDDPLVGLNEEELGEEGVALPGFGEGED